MREEDRLFLRLAVEKGLISEAHAQEALSSLGHGRDASATQAVRRLGILDLHACDVVRRDIDDHRADCLECGGTFFLRSPTDKPVCSRCQVGARRAGRPRATAAGGDAKSESGSHGVGRSRRRTMEFFGPDGMVDDGSGAHKPLRVGKREGPSPPPGGRGSGLGLGARKRGADGPPSKSTAARRPRRLPGPPPSLPPEPPSLDPGATQLEVPEPSAAPRRDERARRKRPPVVKATEADPFGPGSTQVEGTAAVRSARAGRTEADGGPLVAEEGPSSANVGPAVTREGPAVTREGPAVTREGPAVTREGPAVAKERPSIADEPPPARKARAAAPRPAVGAQETAFDLARLGIVDGDDRTVNLSPDALLRGEHERDQLGETLVDTKIAKPAKDARGRRPKRPSAPEVPPAEAVQEEDPLVGQEIGGCRIEHFLGRGGMGAVYLATQLDLERKIAFKVLSPELTQDKTQVEQFFREARALARLEHPNIVSIYNVGKDQGVHFLLMQLVSGGNLEEWLAEAKEPSVDEVCRLVEQIASGLRDAHKKGIVHRDVKPANVLVADGPILKLTDFGLARIEEENLAFGEGRIVGTPYFMAPEQIDGRKVDARADIYSLGATFYYMLTGQHPFEGDSAVEVLLQHVNDPLVPPEQVDPRVPEAISNVVCKMMEKEADKRYGRLEDVLRDLAAIRSGKSVKLEVEHAAEAARVSQAVFTDSDGKPLAVEELYRPVAYQRPRTLYAAAATLLVACLGLIGALLGPLRSSLHAAARPALGDELPPSGRPGDSMLKAAAELAAAGNVVAAHRRLLDLKASVPDLAEVVEKRLKRLTAEAVARAKRAGEDALQVAASGHAGRAIEDLLAYPRAEAELAPEVARHLDKALASIAAQLDKRGIAYVAGGKFLAGEKDGSALNPRREARTGGFYIGRTEVSNREYQVFVQSSSAKPPAAWPAGKPPVGAEDLPVTGVTWLEARSYARAHGGRLPTPDEWEKAASWDPVKKTKRVFPWGDAPRADACNYAGARRQGPLAPGSMPGDVAACGAVDLAGNVSEWTFGPTPAGGGREVALIFGGSFRTKPLDLTRASFYVGPYGDSYESPAVGFRVVYDDLPR